MSSILLGYILFYSNLYHVDPNLVKAVVQVESRGISNKIGKAGEIGLMQLMPTSFHGNLQDPKTNIRIGVKYLAQMKKECPHQVDDTWVICYNMGVAGASKVKHPKLWPYYVDVMAEYKRVKEEERVEDLSIQNGFRKREADR